MCIPKDNSRKDTVFLASMMASGSVMETWVKNRQRKVPVGLPKDECYKQGVDVSDSVCVANRSETEAGCSLLIP